MKKLIIFVHLSRMFGLSAKNIEIIGGLCLSIREVSNGRIPVRVLTPNLQIKALMVGEIFKQILCPCPIDTSESFHSNFGHHQSDNDMLANSELNRHIMSELETCDVLILISESLVTFGPNQIFAQYAFVPGIGIPLTWNALYSKYNQPSESFTS